MIHIDSLVFIAKFLGKYLNRRNVGQSHCRRTITRVIKAGASRNANQPTHKTPCSTTLVNELRDILPCKHDNEPVALNTRPSFFGETRERRNYLNCLKCRRHVSDYLCIQSVILTKREHSPTIPRSNKSARRFRVREYCILVSSSARPKPQQRNREGSC